MFLSHKSVLISFNFHFSVCAVASPAVQIVPTKKNTTVCNCCVTYATLNRMLAIFLLKTYILYMALEPFVEP
jgi:hypothetical protein